MPDRPPCRLTHSLSFLRRRLLPVLAGWAWLASASATPTPQGPEVVQGTARAEMVLNGLWRFQPVLPGGPASDPDESQWGSFPVPGTMKGDWRVSLPRTPVERGSNAAWAAFAKTPAKIPAAWYERQVTLPEAWAGREIRLRFDQVGTDALIWIDHREAGMVGFQGGGLDVGGFLTPGKPARLRVLVLSSRKEIKDLSFTGRGVPADPGDCAATGLTGEVVLTSQPARIRVENVRIDTSLRRRELALQVSFGHTPASAIGCTFEFTVKVKEPQGRQALSFTCQAKVGEDAMARFSHPWLNPHLWDTNDPFVHQLVLQVNGHGIKDEVIVPQFGFREFWTEGRDLFLNGSLIRLRPGEASAASNIEAMRADFARRRHQGCNILEVWPQSTNERGYTHFRSLYAQIASQEGMLLMMPTTKLNDYFPKRQEGLERWITQVRREWQPMQNEPSIVIMVPSANMQWLPCDLDPAWLGRADTPPADPYQARDWQLIDEANGLLRQMDPTRPILHHQGGPRTDISASNTYLNFLPLQEREEYPRAWADRSVGGVLPFCAIEFGTPLDCSFYRSRNGFGNAYASEPWLTEFSAIYLGPQAYTMESAAYRNELVLKDYTGLDPLTGAARWKGRQNAPALLSAPAFQRIQQRFQTQTQRAWRTWGISGGLLPWNDGHAHRHTGYEEMAMPFTPGQRGSYYPKQRKSNLVRRYDDGGYEIYPASAALESGNQSTLAWIAGQSADFTEKSHHFPSGGTLRKSLALINDTRRDQAFTVSWKLTRGDITLIKESTTGRLTIGEVRLHPISLALPAATTKAELTLSMEAKIGDATHRDSFTLRVWPAAPAADSAGIRVMDPVGKTRQLPGLSGVPDTGERGKPAGLIVIGREALSGGQLPLTRMAELQAEVASGRTLLIMAQQPGWMRNWWGFRLSRHTLGHAWPVNPEDPFWKGFDAEDLRDWSGSGTLITPRPVYNPAMPPQFNYRWGTQGSVSCAAIEKPHLSGWTPLLQGGFDLQYTPLMELRHGKGRVILCTLDFEDQVPHDPAAEALWKRLLAYALDAIPPRSERRGIVPNDFPLRYDEKDPLFAASLAIHAHLARPGQATLGALVQPLATLNTRADREPWLRFARWRFTRVQHQMKANSGQEFPADTRIFQPRCDHLDLSGLWEFRPVQHQSAPPGKPLPDSGLTPLQKDLCQSLTHRELFKDVWVPESLMDDVDADGILRRAIELPAHWQDRALTLELGTLQATAMIFLNGQPVSGTTPLPENQPIHLSIPAGLAKAGANVLGVRLWDAQGPGGFTQPAATRLTLSLQDVPVPVPLYHPDYRADFKDGDEPYRFFRW